VDEEEIQIKMDGGVAGFFTRFGGIYFVFGFGFGFFDLCEAEPCPVTQNEIVVS